MKPLPSQIEDLRDAGRVQTSLKPYLDPRPDWRLSSSSRLWPPSISYAGAVQLPDAIYVMPTNKVRPSEARL